MTKKASSHYGNEDSYVAPVIPTTNSEHNRTLQVSANPSELSDSEVVSYFASFGPIEQVTIPFDKTKNQWKGFLYILYDKALIVNHLIKNPTKMIDGKKVLVAKKPTTTPNILPLTPQHFAMVPATPTTNLPPSNSASPFFLDLPSSEEYATLPQYPVSPTLGVAGPSGIGGST